MKLLAILAVAPCFLASPFTGLANAASLNDSAPAGSTGESATASPAAIARSVSAVSSSSPPRSEQKIEVAAKPQSPRLGQIALGAFAPEAAHNSGIDNPCLMVLDDDATYRTYRTAVRSTYGADLSDMNYLGVGMPDWEIRCQWFRDWLFRAAKYGDPTIDIEPIGPAKYGVFADCPEMRDLRQVFNLANGAGITVWVRFCSEANDQSNPYNVLNSPAKVAQYRQAVRWFHSYMPHNVRLVFCPLINDLYSQYPIQAATIRAMYVAGDYDSIGGTLYATTWVSPVPAYSWYYSFMSKLDPKTRFQICELGGTFAKKDEIVFFLADLQAGKWPKVDRVNLFAGDLNKLAITNHGHFGLVLPGAPVSYLRPLIVSAAIAARSAAELAAALAAMPPARLAAATLTFNAPDCAPKGRMAMVSFALGTPIVDAETSAPVLNKLEIPLAAPVPSAEALKKAATKWRSDEMTIKGTTVATSPTYQTFVMLVTDMTNSAGEHLKFSPARKKRIYLQPDAMITTPGGLINPSQLASINGAVTEVTGFDQGAGTPLQAIDVVVNGD